MPGQQHALAAVGSVSLQLYQELLAALRPIGPFREEVKKTSIHLVRGSAFAGIHPRKQYLLLTIKSEKPLRDPRVVKAEQVSKNRWHVEVKLSSGKDINPQLLAWLLEAYNLCG